MGSSLIHLKWESLPQIDEVLLTVFQSEGFRGRTPKLIWVYCFRPWYMPASEGIIRTAVIEYSLLLLALSLTITTEEVSEKYSSLSFSATPPLIPTTWTSSSSSSPKMSSKRSSSSSFSSTLSSSESKVFDSSSAESKTGWRGGFLGGITFFFWV